MKHSYPTRSSYDIFTSMKPMKVSSFMPAGTGAAVSVLWGALMGGGFSTCNRARQRSRGASPSGAAGWSLTDRRGPFRSDVHTSELQSLIRISYAVFCLLYISISFHFFFFFF